MKRLIFAVAVLVCAALHAENAAANAAKDPAAPFDDYGPAMASTVEHPLTVVWQDAHADELKKALTDETLAGFVADAAAADALLAKIRPAYETDALVSIQIAAVSQWVMLPDPWYCLFWDGEHAAGRKVWVNALMSRIETTDDSYVKEFCLDQLRWCGCTCPKLVARIKAVEAGSSDKAVKELAGIVLREIAGKGIGR